MKRVRGCDEPRRSGGMCSEPSTGRWVPPRRMRRGCVALGLQLILKPSSKLFEEFLGPQSEVRSGRTEVGEIGESMQGAMSLSTKPIEVPPGGAGSLLEVELLILCQQPPTRIPPLRRPCSASRSRFAYRSFL